MEEDGLNSEPSSSEPIQNCRNHQSTSRAKARAVRRCSPHPPAHRSAYPQPAAALAGRAPAPPPGPSRCGTGARTGSRRSAAGTSAQRPSRPSRPSSAPPSVATPPRLPPPRWSLSCGVSSSPTWSPSSASSPRRARPSWPSRYAVPPCYARLLLHLHKLLVGGLLGVVGQIPRQIVLIN